MKLEDQYSLRCLTIGPYSILPEYCSLDQWSGDVVFTSRDFKDNEKI